MSKRTPPAEPRADRAALQLPAATPPTPEPARKGSNGAREAGDAGLDDAAASITVDLDPLASVHGAPGASAGAGAGAATGEPPRKKKDAKKASLPPRLTRPRKNVFTTYKERVHELSELLVAAQKPIRILDAVKWREDAYEHLRKTRFRELPPVDAAYYQHTPLGFDPAVKLDELDRIARRVDELVGKDDPLGAILHRNCRQYIDVVRMLQARGTPDFYKYSRALYGSPKQAFLDDRTTVKELGVMLYDILAGLRDDKLGAEYPKTLSAQDCVDLLNKGFIDYFGDDEVRAILDDGIVSDAAAGSDYVKVNQNAKFSVRDVEILEVHEGWVHVGTSKNGAQQTVATWLGKGPPCTTATQEGLAVLMEVFAFVSLPERAKRLNNRILAIDKAEDGADVLDLIEFYRTEGLDEEQCITNAQRVFRGGVVSGGAPFTKDVTYCMGFVANYNFIRSCIRFGRPELVPFMFVGKVTVEDVPVLYQKHIEGVIDPPRYMPRHFRDLNGLAVWMAYSNFFNKIDLTKVQENLRAVVSPLVTRKG